jgi:PPOX class probable F420-dependent enzyme
MSPDPHPSDPDIPASHRDLLEARVATLATVGRDAYPQLSEIWFLAEDGTIRLSLNTARQKTKNLVRQPACTLFILDVANTFRYLELRCDATVEPDENYVFADQVGAKYDADLRAHDKPGESRVVVTLKLRRVNAVNMGG